MSEELRGQIDLELATDGDATVCADGDADSDILVVEYVSDDEASATATADKMKPDEIADDCDHVLKVCSELLLSFMFIQKLCTEKRNK